MELANDVELPRLRRADQVVQTFRNAILASHQASEAEPSFSQPLSSAKTAFELSYQFSYFRPWKLQALSYLA